MELRICHLIPNMLTTSRLVIAPLVAWFLIQRYDRLAFVFLMIAYVTDFLDGYLARLWSVQSDWGRLLDPIADKVLGVCVFVPLTLVHHSIPKNLLWSMLLRDGLIALIYCSMRSYCLINPAMMSPLWIGKFHTLLQAIVGGVLLAPSLSVLHSPLITALWGTTWISGVAYAYRTAMLWWTK